MTRRSDDGFISMLLQETYQSVPEEEISKTNSDLQEYFTQCEMNSKVPEGDILLLNFLEKNCNGIYKIYYNKMISCFRLKFQSNLLDFPKTWGEFRVLNESLEKKENLLCELTNEESGLRDILLSIETIEKKDRQYYVINYKSELCLVSVNQTEAKYFNKWVQNYIGTHRDTPFEFTDAA